MYLSRKSTKLYKYKSQPDSDWNWDRNIKGSLSLSCRIAIEESNKSPKLILIGIETGTWNYNVVSSPAAHALNEREGIWII